MPFLATPFGVKTELNFVQNGVPVVNVFHTKAGGAITGATLDDINAVFMDYWLAIREALHVSLVLQNITSTDISVANGIQRIFPVVTDNAGVITTAPMAANAAVCVSLRTANTGRSFRGRSYIGGLTNAQLADAQNVTTTMAGIYAGLMTDLISAMTIAGHTLSVLSKYAAGVLRVTGLLTEIISVIVDTKVDSQRRRTAN